MCLPILSTSAFLLPFPYRTASFAPLLILHNPLHTSSGSVSTSFSCSWTCHSGGLFSCCSIFHPCSFLASLVPTQTPPPSHISLLASDHFSCIPAAGTRAALEQKRPPRSVGVPGARTAGRDWKQLGKESPTQPQELQGWTWSLIPWGWWIMQTLISQMHLKEKTAALVQPKNLNRNIALKCWMHPYQAWTVTFYVARLDGFSQGQEKVQL